MLDEKAQESSRVTDQFEVGHFGIAGRAHRLIGDSRNTESVAVVDGYPLTFVPPPTRTREFWC